MGSICTVSCVGSLSTLSALSLNRYVLICHQNLYHRIFTVWKCLMMVLLIYVVGILLVVLNFVGVGEHSFDHKSLECIWNRMANRTYTIVFAIVVVWVPITVTGLSYCKIYLHVRDVRMRVHHSGNASFVPNSTYDPHEAHECEAVTKNGCVQKAEPTSNVSPNDPRSGKEDKGKVVSDSKRKPEGQLRLEEGSSNNGKPQNGQIAVVVHEGVSEAKVSSSPADGRKKPKAHRDSATLKVARALFLIYLVFSVCWVPYSLLLILDANDTFAHELHVVIVVWAHLHPSINWVVYYNTHTKFRAAFRKLLWIDTCCSS